MFFGFVFVSAHWHWQDTKRRVGTTGILSFGRCSLLFPSPTLPYSSCRSVGSTAPYSAGNVTPVNSMSSITMAPLCHTTSTHSLLFRSRGAASIHQLCSMQTYVSNRRKVSSAIVSGAAGSHALSGKARSRVHGRSHTPQPGPELLCNKNRSGTDQVRARSRSTRRVKPPLREATRLEIADTGGLSRPCGNRLRSRCRWQTPA